MSEKECRFLRGIAILGMNGRKPVFTMDDDMIFSNISEQLLTEESFFGRRMIETFWFIHYKKRVWTFNVKEQCKCHIKLCRKCD